MTVVCLLLTQSLSHVSLTSYHVEAQHFQTTVSCIATKYNKAIAQYAHVCRYVLFGWLRGLDFKTTLGSPAKRNPRHLVVRSNKYAPVCRRVCVSKSHWLAVVLLIWAAVRVPALRNQRPGEGCYLEGGGWGRWREWILTLCRVPAVGRVSSLLLLTPYAAYHVPDSTVPEPPSPCCLSGGNTSLQRRKEATRSSDSSLQPAQRRPKLGCVSSS